MVLFMFLDQAWVSELPSMYSVTGTLQHHASGLVQLASPLYGLLSQAHGVILGVFRCRARTWTLIILVGHPSNSGYSVILSCVFFVIH